MNLSEWEGWGWIGSLHAWQNHVGGTSVSNIFSNSSTRITRFWRLLVDQTRVVFLWRFLSITMEIFEYHNGAKGGCVCVPEVDNKDSWATLEKKLCEFFLGKTESMPGKEAVAGGGGFEKSTCNQRSQILKKLNDCVKSGSDLLSGKQFPNLTSNFTQKERLGGFDFNKKSNISTQLRVGWPVRDTKWSWTQAHFALKITVDFEGAGRRSVCWADKTQPISDGTISLDTNREFGPPAAHQAQPVISNTALGTSRVGDVVPNVCQSSWEMGEG